MVFYLAFLWILTGVLGSEEMCRVDVHLKCRVYTIIPNKLPATEEGLEDACSNLDKIKECIAKNVKDCNQDWRPREENRVKQKTKQRKFDQDKRMHSKESEELESGEGFQHEDYREKLSETQLEKQKFERDRRMHSEESESREGSHQEKLSERQLEKQAETFRRMLKDDQRTIDVATEVCDDGSELRESVVRDIACYYRVFEKDSNSQQSRNYTTSALDLLEDRIEAMREGSRSKFNQHRACLMVLFEINYFITEFDENCSSRSKDIALELVEKGMNLDDQCPDEIYDDIQDLLKDFESETREKVYVKSLVDTEE